MSKLDLLVSKVWLLVYEGEETNNNSSENNNNNNNNNEPPRTFTQEDVNRFLAEEKKKTRGQTENLIKELEVLKKSKGLSEQEKVTLSQKIDELNNQLLTKDQLLEKERSKLQREHTEIIQKERDEKENWRNRYTESTIIRSIVDAASDAGAYNTEQIVALLKSNARLVEDTDSEGNSIGTFTPRVKFRDTDKDGKPVTLDLSIEEAVKRMKDLPEKYGNLFKVNLNGGLGGNGSTTGNKPLDPSRIKTMEQYKQNRARIMGKK
jgi:hypothetical protein